MISNTFAFHSTCTANTFEFIYSSNVPYKLLTYSLSWFQPWFSIRTII